ncbi:5-oxoprolinase subunit B family protein [Luteipulveratus halotolerans]|uniref:Allophanate hydrolase n=1 Tax=Luteipulveratus halotolerans TaxID=1631356 RepID=A0A0L6CJF0_9MICO|nr:allophanate hydrolase subunit 1 [Luteipulveratus halotolerans]KNX37921.1 allophanate hydrolase [Luteipulveratus halotolerans]
MRLLPCGDAGLLVELADRDEVLALFAGLDRERPDGVIDLVPAARTLLVTFASDVTDLGRVATAVRSVELRGGDRGDAEKLDVPVVYDGADLADVASLTGLSEREVVAAHTGQEWTVAFCGFAPGFGYLVGEDDRLHVPRRTDPRTKVPTGSVALAGEFSGVYPRESPGGWQLIGRTDLVSWDLHREPPALLSPGVRVRFVEVAR